MPNRWGPASLHGDESLDWSSLPLLRLLNELRPATRQYRPDKIETELVRRVAESGYEPVFRELKRAEGEADLPTLTWTSSQLPKGSEPDPERLRLGTSGLYFWARVISSDDDKFGPAAAAIAESAATGLTAWDVREAENRARVWVGNRDLAENPRLYKSAAQMAAFEKQLWDGREWELDEIERQKQKNPDLSKQLERSMLKNINDSLERCDDHFREVAWHAQDQMDRFLDRPFRRIGRDGVERLDKLIAWLRTMLRPGEQMVNEHPLFVWHAPRPVEADSSVMTFPWIEYRQNADRLMATAASFGLMGYPTRIWLRDWSPQFKKNRELLRRADIYSLTAWFSDCSNKERTHDGLLATIIINGDLVDAFERARQMIVRVNASSLSATKTHKVRGYGYTFRNMRIPTHRWQQMQKH